VAGEGRKADLYVGSLRNACVTLRKRSIKKSATFFPPCQFCKDLNEEPVSLLGELATSEADRGKCQDSTVVRTSACVRTLFQRHSTWHNL